MNLRISYLKKFNVGRKRFSWRLIGTLLIVVFLGVGCDQPIEKSILRVGDKAPSFETIDLHDTKISSEEYAGKPMILRFFNPDCKYCRADTEIFNTYYRKYKEKGLLVVYLDTEPHPAEIEKFIEELKIEFPVVLDTEWKVANLFRVQVVPQTIILDRQHTIVGAILGGVSEAELDDMLGGSFN